MGYCGPMGYGQQFPANGLGRRLKLWDKRGYGLRQVWVKRGLTVLCMFFYDQKLEKTKVKKKRSLLATKRLLRKLLVVGK